jgi:hypothetical protein
MSTASLTALGLAGAPAADFSWVSRGIATVAVTVAGVGASFSYGAGDGSAAYSWTGSGVSSVSANVAVGSAAYGWTASGIARGTLTSLGLIGVSAPYYEQQAKSALYWVVSASAVLNGSSGDFNNVQWVVDASAVLIASDLVRLDWHGIAAYGWAGAAQASSQGLVSWGWTGTGFGNAVSGTASAGTGTATYGWTAAGVIPTQGAGIGAYSWSNVAAGSTTGLAQGAGAAPYGWVGTGVGFAFNPVTTSSSGFGTYAWDVEGSGQAAFPNGYPDSVKPKDAKYSVTLDIVKFTANPDIVRFTRG